MREPQRPRPRSLESLRKEAKRWLAALRAGDAEAHARLAAITPNPPADPTLLPRPCFATCSTR